MTERQGRGHLDVGICAAGAYLPRLRLQRAAVADANAWFNGGLRALARGERSMAGWDEDSVTMAVEASRDCLCNTDRALVRSIIFASTSAPYADRQNAGIVKEALHLADAVGSLDAGGGQRAGTSALRLALDGATAGGGGVLCVAADKHRDRPGSEAELLHGDGAAALLVGGGEPIARYLGSHCTTVDFVDHFRAARAEFNYEWEGRWIRDEGYNGLLAAALAEGLQRLSITPESIDHFIAALPAGSAADTVGRTSAIRAGAVRDSMAATVGYTGAAHPALMLVQALETAEPGERIVVVGFGQGCDILAFEATPAILRHRTAGGVSRWLRRRRAEANYLKFLSFNGLLEMDKGMRAEADFKQPLSALYRHRKTVLGLVGGRSPATGAVQFPRSELSVDVTDGSPGTQQDHPLADLPARVLTHTADNLCHSPDPPACYGMVEFDGGGRMVAEFVDVDPGGIEVGRPVRMMFRIKDHDARRGFTQYFWKASAAP